MYRLRTNSCATISSTALFLSQQSRQYRSSPRGSETSFAPHSAQRALLAIDFRDIAPTLYFKHVKGLFTALVVFATLSGAFAQPRTQHLPPLDRVLPPRAERIYSAIAPRVDSRIANDTV